ncbi:hypothetical protein C3L33_01783, partial [Rhododendron williamsianum]
MFQAKVPKKVFSLPLTCQDLLFVRFFQQMAVFVRRSAGIAEERFYAMFQQQEGEWLSKKFGCAGYKSSRYRLRTFGRSNSFYSEAIADCLEFIKRSSVSGDEYKPGQKAASLVSFEFKGQKAASLVNFSSFCASFLKSSALSQMLADLSWQLPLQNVWENLVGNLALEKLDIPGVHFQKADLSWQLTLQNVWENLVGIEKEKRVIPHISQLLAFKFRVLRIDLDSLTPICMGNYSDLDAKDGDLVYEENDNSRESGVRSCENVVFPSLPLAIKWLWDGFQVLLSGARNWFVTSRGRCIKFSQEVRHEILVCVPASECRSNCNHILRKAMIVAFCFE